jgi:hypothetical protein
MVLRVQTRPSTASLEYHRSPEARRRDTRRGVVTLILITREIRIVKCPKLFLFPKNRDYTILHTRFYTLSEDVI